MTLTQSCSMTFIGIHMTVKEFTQDFFDRDNCPINKKRKLRGTTWSLNTLLTFRCQLHNFILPEFGDRELSSLTIEELDNYGIRIKHTKNLSHHTINKIMQTFNIILKEAENFGFVKINVLRGYEKFRGKSRKKGFLTEKETLELFRRKDIWHDDKHRVLHLILCYTGMRTGEAFALGYRSIIEEEDRVGLYIDKSFHYYSGLGQTKTGYNRIVPIPKWLLREIKENLCWIADFWFTHQHGTFLKPATCRKYFYASLEKIGISPAERKERNIGFHSWRHRFISMMNGEIPDEKLRSLVGHRTAEMTENYTQQILSRANKFIQSDYFRQE